MSLEVETVSKSSNFTHTHTDHRHTDTDTHTHTPSLAGGEQSAAVAGVKERTVFVARNAERMSFTI